MFGFTFGLIIIAGEVKPRSKFSFSSTKTQFSDRVSAFTQQVNATVTP